jgi:hypothetical protein
MAASCHTCCVSSLEGDDPVRLLLLLATAATVSGCRFWYKPVPVDNAIGDEKTVLAGDTLSVHRDSRFEVYGPSPEAVYDGYEQLHRAYRAFERYFGIRAPRLAIVLAKDTSRPMDPAVLRDFRDRGFSLVRYARPKSFKSPSRYGALGYGGVVWPVAPTAARTMLARFVDSQLPPTGDGVRTDSALLARFPLWYRAAIIHLIGEAGAPANDLDYVREKRGQVSPLRDLLTLVRSPSADSILDPSRRSEADEFTRIVAAQASTLAQFLVDREGAAVLGQLGRGYLAGRSIHEMIAEFKNAPKTIGELDQKWRTWIDTHEN